MSGWVLSQLNLRPTFIRSRRRVSSLKEKKKTHAAETARLISVIALSRPADERI